MKAEFTVALLAAAMLCVSTMAQEENADSWYQKGQELARNGSLLDAVQAYDKAIDLNPGNLDARLNKAMALYEAGEINESVFATDETIKAAIGYLGDLNQSSQVSIRSSNQSRPARPQSSAEAWDHRGFLLADLAGPLGNNMSMYEEAIKYFERAIELDPQRKEAWIFKGSVLDTRLNRPEEALLAYDKAIELDGTNAEDNESLSNAWSGKGTALAKLRRYNESIEAFDKAIELNPQNAVYMWYANATALNASGLYSEAVKAYDRTIEQSKDNVIAALAYEGKGSALFKLGKYDEAVSAYDKAIELFPSEQLSGPAWYKKGTALKALGRTSDADAAFAKSRERGYQE